MTAPRFRAGDLVRALQPGRPLAEVVEVGTGYGVRARYVIEPYTGTGCNGPASHFLPATCSWRYCEQPAVTVSPDVNAAWCAEHSDEDARIRPSQSGGAS